MTCIVNAICVSLKFNSSLGGKQGSADEEWRKKDRKSAVDGYEHSFLKCISLCGTRDTGFVVTVCPPLPTSSNVLKASGKQDK